MAVETRDVVGTEKKGGCACAGRAAGWSRLSSRRAVVLYVKENGWQRWETP